MGLEPRAETKIFRIRSTWSIVNGSAASDRSDLEISSRDDHRSKNEPKRPRFERARRVSRFPRRPRGVRARRVRRRAPGASVRVVDARLPDVGDDPESNEIRRRLLYIDEQAKLRAPASRRSTSRPRRRDRAAAAGAIARSSRSRGPRSGRPPSSATSRRRRRSPRRGCRGPGVRRRVVRTRSARSAQARKKSPLLSLRLSSPTGVFGVVRPRATAT